MERTYHHGDLHVALIEAGLAALKKGSSEALSLRALAREVGVSATAVYRHFPDKAALLKALSTEGYARLGAAQRVAAEAAGGGKPGFAEAGRTYVRFALANPALFRLTFTHTAPSGDDTFGNDAASRLLLEYARNLAGADAERLAIQAWSVVHGLAMLMLDGCLPHDETMIDTVIDSATLFASHGNSNEASP